MYESKLNLYESVILKIMTGVFIQIEIYWRPEKTRHC